MTKEEANKLKEDIKNISDNPLFNIISKDAILYMMLEKIDRLTESEDCRNCKKWNECPCGKEGHENGTSIGYSIGECKDYEPCEDAVSRETIRELTKRMYLEVSNTDYDVYSISDCVSYVASKCRQYIDEHILDLPPVTPQPKTGHWIYTSKRRLIDETDEGCVYITDYRCTCSECGGDFGFQKMSDAYCKYCGAKMEVGE